MYYLYNLVIPQGKDFRASRNEPAWTANPLRFAAKNDLLDFWSQHIGSFDMLNVTGRDISTDVDFISTGVRSDGNIIITKVEERHLRPYLVVDENGRHEDIRNWIREREKENTCSSVSSRWSVKGTKQSIHRMSGPSMRHRTLRDSTRDFYTDLDGSSLVEVPGVRKKLCINRTDEENFYCSENGSKSWKDQHKAANQFAKHRAGCHRRKKVIAPAEDLWATLAAAGFCLSPATLESCA